MVRIGRHLARLARILFTGSAFFVFWWGGAFLTWVVLPIIRLRHRRDPSGAMRRCRQLLNRSLRLHADYMRFFRLIEFDSRAVERQLPSGAFVMVANHPSLIDTVLLLSTYPTLYCVVKGSVMRSSFVGSMLRYCNHIDAGDGDPVSGASVVQGAIERLRSGDPVLIFPEGTRSPENGLGPFKKGAFAIAQAANVPVIPIRIQCQPRGLMRGQKWYQVPDGTIRYSFRLFPPRSPAEYAGDLAAMAGDVRSLFLD
jgi:1-acyl-sn-glycerol-3-phosphate acyltransferase